MSKRLRYIQIGAAIYFIIVAAISYIGSLYHHHVSGLDYAILVFYVLPLLVNRRWFYVLFGTFNALIWLYFTIAVFSGHVNYVQDHYQHQQAITVSDIAIGYLFCAVSLTGSLLVAGIQPKHRKPIGGLI